MDFMTLATDMVTHSPENIVRRFLLNEGQQQQQQYNNDDAEEEYDYIANSKPILSKAMETELYLLATNFLLYVAIVIIIMFIAKIYFPELLERERNDHSTARTFELRMADSQEQKEQSNSNENENEHNNTTMHPSYFDYNDDTSHNEEENEDAESDCMSNDEDRSHLNSTDDFLLAPLSNNKKTTSSNIFEFEQETMSKTQVMKRLAMCCIMLNITFVTWGVLQERMLTRRYPRHDGEYFTYSYALVFTNRFWTLIMSGLLMLYYRPKFSKSTVVYEYSFPSISNMLSSWCQYEALRYVSFPATTLFKSFKLAPVMVMGKVLGNHTYPTYDYMVAIFIGLGVSMFMSSTDDLSFGYDYLGEKTGSGEGGTTSASWTGLMLLFLYLFFDSFTSQFQSRMFQRHRDLSMIELMFATSAFSSLLSFITLVHTKELYPAFDFVYRHSEIHLHFFAFSICSTIGQLSIFYTIKNFGAVVFTLIMTTRILLSIALSCLLYGHQVSSLGFLGLMIVMGSVLYRIKRKSQVQQLLKWSGMDGDDIKASELVQEWHEHIDM